MLNEMKNKSKRFKKIYVEITNRCNLHCPFCAPSKRRIQDMTSESYQQIINEISPYTDYVYLHLRGEPLLHPELTRIFQISEEKKINVNLTTNGVFLLKHANLLLNSSIIKRVNVSFQSLLAQSEVQQERYFQNFQDFLSKFALTAPFNLSIRLWHNQEKEANQAFNQKIITFLREKCGANIPQLPNNKAILPHVFIEIDNEFTWPSLEQEEKLQTVKCYGGISHLGILVDGTVTLCCLDYEGETNLGNIFEKPFSQIISSPEFESMLNRNRLPKTELCKHCTYHERFQK